ncbi:MAG: hypothetical protein K0S80_2750 [Neobacillus sp.]|nr:hypothetical protein [Neobacillus sp.]
MKGNTLFKIASLFPNKRLNKKYVIIKLDEKRGVNLRNSNNRFNSGQTVKLKDTGEEVTILKWQYVKNMKRYSYIVKEHPGTFFFEEEFQTQ